MFKSLCEFYVEEMGGLLMVAFLISIPLFWLAPYEVFLGAYGAIQVMFVSFLCAKFYLWLLDS
jgi:hypothetical protein